MLREQSEQWHERAKKVIIGGVNSPSRSFHAVGKGAPVTIVRGQGAYLYDVDGNRYIDYLAAFGPIITGHAHPRITAAVTEAMSAGSLIGAPTPYETEYAERLQAAIPELERIRFVNSGTEAMMTIIRVARAYTGRTKVLKCAGCYHGHSDLVLVAAGSGPSSLGIPDSAGVPQAIADDVVTIPYNDTEALSAAIARYGDELACILTEPVVGNFGIVEPQPGYLRALRDAADHCGALLVYDEVITAFRFRFGAVCHDDTKPDLMALGKIIGGGLPIGAYGGKQAIMEQVAPLGPAYQAGTMAGNPASLRAGMACLELLSEPGVYERLAAHATRLTTGIAAAAERASLPVTINRYGGAFAVYFTDQPVRDYEAAKQADSRLFSLFFHALLNRNVMLAASKYEAWFVTMAHTDEDITQTLSAVDDSLAEVARHA
ncbi:MAG: glutamate-1-semialdehyde 2,1-aminomutase [Firmicutes bacterium]|nr:glutamate-1-semialdehyde 2,1-aminomutase [Bacillota bacterium]